jgi:hypothetical protein
MTKKKLLLLVRRKTLVTWALDYLNQHPLQPTFGNERNSELIKENNT